MAWDCVKCLVLKGFAVCQHHSMKKVSNCWQILLAIFPPCHRLQVSPVMVAFNPTLNNNGTNAKN